MLWLECLMNQVGRKEQGRKAPRGRLCLTMAFFYGEANTPVTELAIFSNQIILSCGETSKENWRSIMLKVVGWLWYRQLAKLRREGGSAGLLTISRECVVDLTRCVAPLAHRRLSIRFRRNFVSRAKMEVVVYLMNFNQWTN